MGRLPIPGADSGNWGTLLDAYLRDIFLSVKDYGAKGDNATDDTGALQAAINAAAVAGGVVFFPPGTYLVSSQLNLSSPNVTFQGAGSNFSTIKKANSSNNQLLHLLGAVGTNFYDLGFDLNGTTNAAQPYGIWMDAPSNNVAVERCNFFNADGFCVFVFGGPTGRTTNLRLVNSDFTQLAGGSHDLLTFISQGGGVHGCRFSSGGNQIGLNVYESNDVQVDSNTFTSNGGGNSPCTISSCTGVTVNGNTLLCGTADYGIRLIVETDNGNARNSQDTVISNNTIRMVATGTSKGISVEAAAKTITGTQILGNVIDSAVFAIYYNNGTITGVEVADNRFQSCSNIFGNNVVPTGKLYHHNPGYNPVGNIAVGADPLAPAVPSSGSSVSNVTGVDCSVRIICGAGVSVSAVTLGGTTLTGVTVAASTTSGEIRVPAGQQIGLTYAGGTPTWQWFGD